MSPFLTENFNDIEPVLAKTMEYLMVPAVVGFEKVFLTRLAADFEHLGLKTRLQKGLLAVSGKRPDSAIVCAHVDRHGLISLGGNQYVYAAQRIREERYGDANKASQKELQNISERFQGEHVFAYDPASGDRLGEGMIESCQPCIIAGDAQFTIQGLDDIPPHTPVAYGRTARVENDYLKGQLDNALSVGVIYSLFKRGFEGTALLSAEEEIGKSWIHLSAYLEKYKIETGRLLVLDTSPYVDAAPIKEGLVVLRNRDTSEIFNSALTRTLRDRCAALGLRYHMKDEYLLSIGKTVEQLGSTELGKLIKNREGRWSGATVQIPTLMYHTSRETTSLQALRHYYHFLTNILIEDPLPAALHS